MANAWFRLYREFATDPKVQRMSEAYQRRLIMLMCEQCGNENETLHDEDCAFQMRISVQEWSDTKAELIARNIIDEDNRFVNWNKRQYRSDSSTERVRRHREAKKQQYETPCNVSVTPPDTDSDTDTEYKYMSKFDDFWSAFADKRGRAAAERVWKRIRPDADLADKIIRGAKRYASERGADKKYWKMPQGWLNDGRWDDGGEPVKQEEMFTAKWWRQILGPSVCETKFQIERRDRLKTDWNGANGPNPWKSLNPKMPPEIRQEYAAWGWKE